MAIRTNENISAGRNSKFCAGVLLLSLLFPSAGASAADDLRSYNLDDVVVVSVPKEHAALDRQPVSSTSLGAGALEQHGVEGIKDLTAHVPGLFIPDYGSRLTSSIYLRGIGSRTGTPAVGLYVDGIPMNDMSSMDQDLSDAERIDVLRGPQGTLYGHNTMGGLIRVYTRNPMQYQGTDIVLGAGSYNSYRVRATHYHRPSERFAFSGGVSYRHDGGFFKNAVSGRHMDKSDDLSVRWRGVFRPSGRVNLDLSVHYERTDQGGYPYEAADGADKGRITANRASSYKRDLLFAGLNAEHDLDRFVLTSTTGFQWLNDRMMMDQDFSRLDIYTLQQKQRSRTLSEEIALKSKHAGRRQWTQGVSTQYQWLRTQAPVTFFQDGIDWLNELTNSNANQYMPQVVSGPMTMDFIFDNQIVALDGTPTETGIPFGASFHSPVLTTGIFHQEDFNDLFGVKGLSLGIGLRLDYEYIRLDHDAGFRMQQVYGLNGLLTMPNMSRGITMVPATTFEVADRLKGGLSHDDWQLLPRFSLQYEDARTGNVYASVSRGYRSGGYNIQMFNELMQSMMRTDMMKNVADVTIPVLEKQASVPDATKEQVKGILNGMAASETPDVDGTVRFKPESAWNLEVGSHLHFLDGRLKADVAAFWIETRDLQLSQMAQSGLGRVTVNAGESRSLGWEASLQAAVTNGLSVSAGYGCTDARLKHSGTEEHPADFHVPFAPRHTVSAGARHTWPTNGWMERITLSADIRGNGRIWWTRENDLSQPFHTMADARLTVTHHRTEISFWGDNLTGTDYNAFCFVTRGQTFVQRGRPFCCGVSVRMGL